MRAIDQKLWRDLLHLKGQIIATTLVVMCGVASFVSMRTTYASLLDTQQEYYADYRFADVFAHVTRAPESVSARLERVPGVATVRTRVVSEATLALPGLAEPAQGKIVSIPDEQTPTLNDLFIRRGRYVRPNAMNEVIVSEAFAVANRFEPGDRFEAVLNGSWRRLTIVGIALSPEYIYEIRPGDIFPDNRRYGILWMGRSTVAAAFQMQQAFNDVTVALAPGASEEEVIDSVDTILAPWGGTGAIGRPDRSSNRFIDNEFSQLRVQAIFLPAVFLGVTAFLLHLVMSRLVKTQREQIGLMKAFGYGSSELAIHFLLMAFAAVSFGLVLGIALGMWFGAAMTDLYTEYFHFPLLNYSPDIPSLAVSLVITFGTAALGSASALRSVSLLPPAEAMRPEAPPNYSAGVLESIGLYRRLGLSNRIVVRNMVRWPVKSVLGIFGIACAAALLFTGYYFFDAIDRIIEVQFHRAIRNDVDITFSTTQPGRVRAELAHLPGTMKAEFYRAVPVRVQFAGRSKRVALLGREPDADLRRLVDSDGGVVHLPPEGVVLSSTLADILGVSEGNEITVAVLEGDRRVRAVPVTGVFDELMGTNAYMAIRTLNRFLDEDDVVSGAHIESDPSSRDELYAALKQKPEVAGVGFPGAMLKSFNDTFARTIGTFTIILVSFAGVIVFGVVYNSARISLSERSRELASLRVLGFTRREISTILLTEQGVATLAAIPVGFIVGYLLSILTNNLVDTELMRLPLVFSTRTFVLTALIVIVAALVSGLLVAWRLRKLDLIEVLKSRE